jgi:histidinol-phosphate aminotransferase
MPRKAVARVTAGVHGGIDYAELTNLGISPDDILDFSANLNPCGFPPGIRPLVKGTLLSKYPDSSATDLTGAIARKTGRAQEEIIAGSGSTELIRLAVSAYLGEGDSALIIEPTYGEYRTACEIAGADVITHRLSPSNNFRLNIDDIIRSTGEIKPKVIFLCNPNNPTGAYVGSRDFQNLLKSQPDSLVILDEAYISFVRNRWDSLDFIGSENLLVIRSLTKDYALADKARYAAGTKYHRRFKEICPPWNVNIVPSMPVSLRFNMKISQGGVELALSEKQFLIGELKSWIQLPAFTYPFFPGRCRQRPSTQAPLLKRAYCCATAPLSDCRNTYAFPPAPARRTASWSKR